MRIALVILHADPARGGAERYTIDLAEALVKAGHDVSLLATTFADVPPGVARVQLAANGWSRIGRSGTADIRLDDPTVSRRHAVIVRTPEGDLRVLDDRSMNGIRVNDEPVDWSPLADGDELQIGRYTLHVIESGD